MTKIEIFNTGYAWNWLNSLNTFIDGVLFGTGLVLVLLLFIYFIHRPKVPKNEEIHIEKVKVVEDVNGEESMNTDQKIYDILKKALIEIRKQQGLAITEIHVQWLSTVEDPAVDVTQIHIEGGAAP